MIFSSTWDYILITGLGIATGIILFVVNDIVLKTNWKKFITDIISIVIVVLIADYILYYLFNVINIMTKPEFYFDIQFAVIVSIIISFIFISGYVYMYLKEMNKMKKVRK